MKRRAVLVVVLGMMLVTFLARNALALEVFVEKETINVGGVVVELVRTANNFIVMFDSSSSMGERFGSTNMTKLEAGKKLLQDRNKRLPDLGYNAGLYSFSPKSRLGKMNALEPYYPMKRYNKEEFGKAIESLPDKAGGATFLQAALRELDAILKGLPGRTAIFVFTDGTYSRDLGPVPVELAKDLAKKYDVCFYVISTAKGAAEKQIVERVASINECSRAMAFEDLWEKPEYVSGALWVLDKRFVDAFITREKVVGVKLDNILFDFNKTEIKPEHYGDLNRLGTFLQGNPDAYVVFVGFTDSVGTEEYNLGLSRRRAESAAGYLMSRFNVDDERIGLLWYGKAAPVADNTTAEGRRLNRRVVTIVSGLD